MILHPEDAHSCKEQSHAKILYLSLIVNKPSQYITFELLKRTENINTLQNIYMEFAGCYDMAAQHFPSQEHLNISPTLPSPLLLYSVTGLRQSEFPTATLHVWTR